MTEMVGALAFGLVLSLAVGPVDDGPLSGRALVVGTKSTPPFVVHGPDGRWSGPSIDLWREIAGELDLRFELQERDLDGLIHGLEDGSLDLAMAALTVTADRERRVDFSHPFFSTGLAIARAHGRPDGWIDVALAVFNMDFLRLLLIFAGLQLAVGALMWLIERSHNPHFQGARGAGLISGLWWAVVTMATVGYGDKVPQTGAGRLLAMVWMLASLIILTTVTAAITSSLTVGRLEAKVSGPEDLGKLRVGTVGQTTSEVYLSEMKLNFRAYPSAAAGLAAIAAREIDALVHDELTLRSLVATEYSTSIDVLPRIFRRQDYAFALPTGSPLREPIDRILARRMPSL